MSDSGTSSGKKKRTSSNELELMREIIANDKHLFEKVMKKIREIRGSSKVGLIEEMADKPVRAGDKAKISNRN